MQSKKDGQNVNWRANLGEAEMYCIRSSSYAVDQSVITLYAVDQSVLITFIDLLSHRFFFMNTKKMTCVKFDKRKCANVYFNYDME